MNPIWIYVADSVPSDNAYVYIRLAGNEYNPIYCQYRLSPQAFDPVVGDVRFPLNEVLKWSAG